MLLSTFSIEPEPVAGRCRAALPARVGFAGEDRVRKRALKTGN
jgi:hypothetical protein